MIEKIKGVRKSCPADNYVVPRAEIHTMMQRLPGQTVGDEQRHGKAVEALRREISDQCIECNICVRQCAFLDRYGTPKSIADNWQPGNKESLALAYECSLCGLCGAVCPVKIDPKRMFLEMRRYAVAGGGIDLAKQKPLIDYERRGTSKRYSFYGLPAGCDTILFPGCALAGTRPQRVIQLFEHLQNFSPNLGIVLDCCTKPSHDLGRSVYFHAMFSEMQQYLAGHSIKNILVACPSCYEVFSRYGKRFTTRSVYEILAREYWEPEAQLSAGPVTIQDSCVARFEKDMQQSIRKLIRARGIPFEEMKHHGEKTLCCGEGGGAHFVAPELAGNWAAMRKREVGNRRIVTYCAGCAHFLDRIAPTAHLLDLLFAPGATLAGRAKVSRPPFTYLNRLLLKRRFRKKQNFATIRERDILIAS